MANYENTLMKQKLNHNRFNALEVEPIGEDTMKCISNVIVK